MKSSKTLTTTPLHRFILLSLFAIHSPSIFAGEDPTYPENTSEKIVITANRMETPADQVANSVTVIDRKEIERSGKDQVYEILRSVPGVTVHNAGGTGQLTYVLMRGTDSNKVLVLIDGVKMNDPISPDRAFDFGSLPLDHIERIEVIRGPQSVLYGSDAIGGVINIITQKGSKNTPQRFGAEIQAGSYKTTHARGDLTGSQNEVHYSLNASIKNSEGFSAADQALGYTEKDGYSLKTFSGSLGGKASDHIDWSLNTRYSQNEASLDNPGGTNVDDPNYKSLEKFFSTRIELKGRALEKWQPKAAISYSLEKRQTKNEADSIDPSASDYSYDGFRVQGQFESLFMMSDESTFHFGIDLEREQGKFSEVDTWNQSSVDNKGANILGFYAQHRYLSSAFFASTGIRYDSHQISGSRLTYRFAPGLKIAETGTTIKGTLGTGFKTPSVYQIYSPAYGSTSLKPETSLSYDLGIDQKWGGNRYGLSATYFKNQLNDLLGFDSNFKYYNINKARTEGIELSSWGHWTQAWSTQLSYTYLVTRNEITDQELLRRPKHQLSAETHYDLKNQGSASLRWRYTGIRNDIDSTTFQTKGMSPYSVLDLSASTRLNPTFKVFGRIENILDAQYEEIDGYGTPGRSFFLGLRAEI